MLPIDGDGDSFALCTHRWSRCRGRISNLDRADLRASLILYLLLQILLNLLIKALP